MISLTIINEEVSKNNILKVIMINRTDLYTSYGFPVHVCHVMIPNLNQYLN